PGREAVRAMDGVYHSAEDFALRLTYSIGETSYSRYDHLAPPTLNGRMHAAKFMPATERVNYSGPLVLFVDVCKLERNPAGGFDQTIISDSTYGILVDVESSAK